MYAIISALLFGISTPIAKQLLWQVQPQLLAGLFYLGSGLGLSLCMVVSKAQGNKARAEAALKLADIPWLIGAIFCGGLLAPFLLMTGLSQVSASGASLLLNLEGVFTAILGWFAFKENFDRRIFLGMALIVVGGCFLSWTSNGPIAFSMWTLAIIAACFCWGIDNNLTRKISAADPLMIAILKGVFAGVSNTVLSLCYGSRLPAIPMLLSTAAIGFACYGLSVWLFILGLRHLGTARTSAYFSTAPFVGAALSIALLHEPLTANFLIAAGFMGLGVWLHLTEDHSHEHRHEPIEHEHSHVHDEHHQHKHVGNEPPGEAHSHVHKHEDLVHQHLHFPDIHHRHDH